MVVFVTRYKKVSGTCTCHFVQAKRSGLLVLICIEDSDTNESIAKMSEKLLNFKMIDGSKGITSRSLKDSKEEVLIVSQFTLSAITNKGNKPTFHKAAKPDKAKLITSTPPAQG